MNQAEEKKVKAIRRIGWVAGLVLMLILALAGIEPGMSAFRQAAGMQNLLQAGENLTSEEINNPFICLRDGETSTRALVGAGNISDEYLRGAGLCLAGEREAGMAVLKESEGESNAAVQYAAGLSATDPQAGADALAGMDLQSEALAALLIDLTGQAGIDPYPALRLLAQVANEQPRTWSLWLKGSSQLEEASEWREALAWLEEGLAIAPKEARSSLYLRIGRLYETQAEIRDFPVALEFINLALENDGWIYPADEASAHMYRGEVYRSLKDEFTTEQAMAEFQTALEMQPDHYWALLSLGHVYLYDLKDTGQAESYYRQALEVNEQIANAYLHLGDVYRERGDMEAAAAWYQMALERQPDWQAALDRLAEMEGK